MEKSSERMMTSESPRLPAAAVAGNSPDITTPESLIGQWTYLRHTSSRWTALWVRLRASLSNQRRHNGDEHWGDHC